MSPNAGSKKVEYKDILKQNFSSIKFQDNLFKVKLNNLLMNLYRGFYFENTQDGIWPELTVQQ